MKPSPRKRRGDSKVRWFLVDQKTGTAVRASGPQVEVPNWGWVLDQARTFDHDAYNGRPMTVRFPTVTIVPVPGAKPIPLTQLLVPPGHPAKLDRPERVRF